MAILRRRHVGFVFQFFNLISNMTVADNVEIAVGSSARIEVAAVLRAPALSRQAGASTAAAAG